MKGIYDVWVLVLWIASPTPQTKSSYLSEDEREFWQNGACVVDFFLPAADSKHLSFRG